MTAKPPYAPSIFLCSMEKIYAASRMWSEKRCYENFCDNAAAFNTSSMPNVMGDRLFEAVCKLGLEGIVSKKLDTPYRSGPLKASIIGKKFNGPGSNAGPGGSFLMSVSIVPTVNNHTVIRFLTILVDMAASGLSLATKKPTSQPLSAG